MTITATSSTISYNGTSANTALSVPFVFEDSSDLVVIQKTLTTGDESTMVLTTDYTVTGGSGATGTVTVVDGATDFQTGVHDWTILRQTPETQATDFINGDALDAGVIEDAFDKLTKRCQELQEEVDRCLKFPRTEADLTAELPDDISRASDFATFDGSGNAASAADGIATATQTVSSYAEDLVEAANALAARNVLDVEEGTFAARPGSGNSAGHIYSATDTGQLFTWDGSAWVEMTVAATPKENLLINGNFSVNTRNITSTGIADTTRGLDGCRVLTDSGNVTHGRRTDPTSSMPDGYSTSAQFENSVADTQFGVVIGVDGERTRKLVDNGKASYRFRVQIGLGDTTPTRIRHSLLTWSGTVNEMTSDPVTTWNAQDANPTLATSWAFGNTPSAHTTISTSWSTVTVEDVTIGAVENVALMIWADVGDGSSYTANDEMTITGCEIVAGDSLTGIISRSSAEEHADCARHYITIGGDSSRKHHVDWSGRDTISDVVRKTILMPSIVGNLTAVSEDTGDWTDGTSANVSAVVISDNGNSFHFAITVSGAVWRVTSDDNDLYHISADGFLSA